MQLRCQSCGSELHGRDVDLEALRASCRACGWQIGGEQSVYRKPQHSEEARPSPEQTAIVPLPPLPHFIDVTEDSRGFRPRLAIEIRESRLWRFLIGVGLMSLPLVAVIARDGMSWLLVGPLLVSCYVMGIFLANTRYLVVTPERITVRFWPFWRPTKKVEVASLEQLWVDEFRNQDDVTYRLLARLRSGRDVTLVDQVPDPVGVLHLERRIEEMLGLIDKPIAGEIDRPGQLT